MKDHDTNLPEDIATSESEAPAELPGDDFDAVPVFADPVTYLASLGLQSELVETQHNGLPAAA